MKWGVVFVAIVKNEAPYITDWVAYHLSLGVEHFFIYDNGSSDETCRVLDKFICAGVVTLTYWPVRSGQIDAYNHALKFLSQNTEWIGFLDIDEFVVLHEKLEIKAFLSDLGGDQILIPWKNFPYGGHFDKPGGSDLENYFWYNKTGPETIVQVKHIVRASRARNTTAHFSTLAEGRTVIADGTPSPPKHAIVGPTYKGAQINHYMTRSFIENTERMKKGQVSGRSEKKIIDFHRLTEQAATSLGYDDSIIRHFNNFAAERQIWKGRPEYPHRFGLSQKTKVLHSSNPLYYFLLKSYGNYLAGLSDIDHLTKTPLIKEDRSGREIELSRSWFDIASGAAYFRVGANSFQKYFAGSIHYGDFCRRFGFIATLMERRQSINGTHTVSRAWDTGCPLCIFDITGKLPISLLLEAESARDRTKLEEFELPPGRHAGIIYIPEYLAAGHVLRLGISGNGELGELIVGALP